MNQFNHSKAGHIIPDSRLKLKHHHCHRSLGSSSSKLIEMEIDLRHNLSVKEKLESEKFAKEKLDKMGIKNGKKVKKKWQVFPGKNRFYCDGRIMMAKNISVFYFTVILITSTCTSFFYFE